MGGNFKPVKKLDFKNIDSHEQEDNQKIYNQNRQNNIELERANLTEKIISKDLEKYIEFLSKEDDLCDKFLSFQIPYYFLGMNSKQSLSSNAKNSVINHEEKKKEFLKKIEGAFEVSSKSSVSVSGGKSYVNTHGNFPTNYSNNSVPRGLGKSGQMVGHKRSKIYNKQ